MPKKIKVVLGGSEGRMGKILQKLIAQTDDIEIAYGFDPKKADLKNFDNIITLDERVKGMIDVYVDFTSPDSILSNVEQASKLGIDSMIGTTGWYDLMDNVKSMAMRHSRRILYSPNFALGVNVLFYIVDEVAKLLGGFGYDVAVREVHHAGKVDAPSGTAITLGTTLLKRMKKEKLAFERRGKREDSEIDVLGMRVGKIVGHHEVWFTPKKSYSERLIIQHEVFTPEVFGIGALMGIRWITEAQKDRKPAGIYSFYDDVLGLTKIGKN